MKNNKGITLIALIITIIVMLILVAVTVSVVVNSNLIGTASGAKTNTEAAYAEESNISKITIDEKTYASIEHYTNGYIKVSANPTHYLYIDYVTLLIDESTTWQECIDASNGIITISYIEDYYGYSGNGLFVNGEGGLCCPVWDDPTSYGSPGTGPDLDETVNFLFQDYRAAYASNVIVVNMVSDRNFVIEMVAM